ncbi:conserved repeat domain protein [Geitlerinema sp. PCC 7407]|nr:conserved repeat domain protein [Geitlerinema sp. PCC 7407]
MQFMKSSRKALFLRQPVWLSAALSAIAPRWLPATSAIALTASSLLLAPRAAAQTAALPLRQDFIGPFDYVVTGGTLRTQADVPGGNTQAPSCTVTNTSTSPLNGIPAGATIRAAYLYWSGSGNTPDTSITFQGQTIASQQTQTDTFVLPGPPVRNFQWFGGFADVTSIVATSRNGNYTFADLTVATGDPWCFGRAVLSAWSLIVVYEDPVAVPFTNIVNVYDGFTVLQNERADFVLSGLSAPDTPVTKFTGLVWEGDQNPPPGQVTEVYQFEGNTLSDAQNPLQNPFSSSINSLGLGPNVTYGVDLDTFDVSNFTAAGATEVTGTIATGTDLVILAAAVIGARTRAADLELVKTVDTTTPAVGQNITYTLTLTNRGPDTAGGITVNDQLPSGLTYVSDNSGGTYDPATGNWTVNFLGNGQSQQLQITARVNPTGDYANTAQITTSDVPDLDSRPNNNVPTEDDQSTVTIVPQASADLSVAKVVNNTTPNVGERVTFTVTLSNAGPSTATNVRLSDPVPTGLANPVVTPSVGTYDAATGVWSVPAIDSGATATLTLEGTVTATAPTTNVAEVTGSDQPDPDSTPGNNDPNEDDRAIATITPPIADLSLTKAVDNANPSPGDPVTFTVVLTNSGPSTATNVRVSDPVPSGLTNATVTVSAGTYDNATGLWSIPSLANGASVTLTLNGTFNAAGTSTNVAEVTGSDQPDPDSTPGNGSTTEDDRASVTIPARVADLSITKTVDNTAPNVGEVITFTVTLANAGPDTATNIEVSDPIPAGLTNVTVTPATGTYDNNTGLWSLPSLGVGAQTTLTVSGTVGPDAITNTAQVSSTDQTDPDSTPGNSSADEDDQAGVIVNPVGTTPGTGNLRVVKRVTAVTRNGAPLGGVDFSQVVDDPADPNDTVPGWGSSGPIGVPRITESTPLQSGDIVEYTIYLLSDGTAPVQGVNACDPIPAEMTFLPDAFGGGQGTVVGAPGSLLGKTNQADTDEVTYVPPLTPPPAGNACPDQNNPTGALVVNLGEVSQTTGQNVRVIRFRARVN